MSRFYNQIKFWGRCWLLFGCFWLSPELFAQTLPVAVQNAHNQAIAALKQKKYPQAASFFREKLRLLQPLPLSDTLTLKQLAATFFNLAGISRAMGQYEEALTESEQALGYYKQLFQTSSAYQKDVADTEKLRAQVLFGLGLYEESIQTAHRALPAYEQLPTKASELLGLIATNHIVLAQYTEAKSFLEKAKSRIDSTPSEPLAQIYNGLGALYERQDAHVEMQKQMEQALAIRLRLYPDGLNLDLAMAYENLAVAQEKNAQYRAQTKNLEEALRIYQTILGENHHKTARVYILLAQNALELADLGKGQAYAEKAVRVYTEHFPKRYTEFSNAYQVLADCYAYGGNLGKSIEICQKSVRALQSPAQIPYIELAKAAYKLAELYEGQRAYQKAFDFYQVCLDNNLFFARKQALSPEAPHYFWYALSKPLLFQALGGQYRAAKGLNKTHFGYELYQRLPALQDAAEKHRKNLILSADRLAFAKTEQAFWEEMLGLVWEFYQHPNPSYPIPQKSLQETAFRVLEMGKSTTLNQIMRENEQFQASGISESAKQAYRAAQNELTRVQNAWLSQNNKLTINDLEKAYQRLEAASKVVFGDNSVENMPAFGVEILQKTHLSSDKGVWIFHPTAKGAYRLEIYPEKVIFGHYAPTNTDFAKLLNQYTDALLSKNTTEEGCRAYAAAAYGLAQTLIPAEIPKNIQKIAIVADASLANVPFESLLSAAIRPDAACSFADMRYWVDSLGFSYLYSCRWLGWFGQNQPIASSTALKILGLAPNYPLQNPPLDSLRQRLKPLAGARKEIERLRKAYDGLYLLDAAATETNLKQKIANYGLIHFAGHALADMQNPLDSRLVLAHPSESEKEDGYLHLYELSPLSLSARLVILSGCETGAGKHETGEGVLSLAKGFAYAGVPSLLANLWEVPDHATQLIVQYFYEGLKKGLSKDAALQQAKQKFLRETSLQQTHPYYWAAMLQIGDPAPLQIAPIPSKKWWYAGRFLGIFAFVFVLAYYFKKRKQKA